MIVYFLTLAVIAANFQVYFSVVCTYDFSYCYANMTSVTESIPNGNINFIGLKMLASIR